VIIWIILNFILDYICILTILLLILLWMVTSFSFDWPYLYTARTDCIPSRTGHLGHWFCWCRLPQWLCSCACHLPPRPWPSPWPRCSCPLGATCCCPSTPSQPGSDCSCASRHSALSAWRAAGASWARPAARTRYSPSTSLGCLICRTSAGRQQRCGPTHSRQLHQDQERPRNCHSYC
jgi:hypothetical protein